MSKIRKSPASDMPRFKNIIDIIKGLDTRGAIDAPTAYGRAVMLVAQKLSASEAAEKVAYVDFAAMRFLAGKNPPLLSIRKSASTLVRTTDFHSHPNRPKILERPLIVQASNPGKPLFGDTVGLCCYEENGKYSLAGLASDGTNHSSAWYPEWGGGDIEESVSDQTAHFASAKDTGWAQQAASFIIALGVLLESENSPLELRPLKKSKHNETGVYYEPSGKSALEGEDIDTGKLLSSVMVTGHLKRQRFGEKLSKTKWIWVSQYAARRWIARVNHEVMRVL